MQRLVSGLHSLRPDDFAPNDAVVEHGYCEGGDRPVTIYFQCSDAHMAPARQSTGTRGEPFVVANLGNHVPATSACTELRYAVEELLAGEIIVCGHTYCPAIFALLRGRFTPRLRDIIEHHYAGLEGRARSNVAVRENVLVQLEALRTFDFVAKGLDDGTLKMRGWVFDERTHDTFAYDPALEQFVRLETR